MAVDGREGHDRSGGKDLSAEREEKVRADAGGATLQERPRRAHGSDRRVVGGRLGRKRAEFFGVLTKRASRRALCRRAATSSLGPQIS